MRINRSIVFFLSLFGASLNIEAQDIPSLPDDPAIVRGVLPSGVEYFLAREERRNGFADISLVQKGRTDLETARSDSREISAYMSGKGVGYRDGDPLSMEGGSMILSFNSVPVFDQITADSTFVLLTDVMRSYSGPQALMVSGDIDTKELAEQLYMYSLMVPRVGESYERMEYVWEERENPEITVSANGKRDMVSIRLEYRSSRPQEQLMNTVQPLVSYKFAKKAGLILAQRVKDAFYSEKIALDGLETNYRDAASGDGDEIFSIGFNTSMSDFSRAFDIFSSIVAGLDIYGATETEYEYAAVRRMPERSKIERLVSAYIFGSSLASDGEINGFLGRKTLSVQDELALFNGYLSAVLDPERNMTLKVSAPHMLDTVLLKDKFHSAWGTPDTTVYSRHYNITALKPKKDPRKVKKWEVLKDPVTSGEIWTFSNGMKVIYKQLKGSGRFDYALLLRGGLHGMKGTDAQKAYASDVARLFNVGGIDPYSLEQMLNTEDIGADIAIGPSDMRIYGDAPSGSLEGVLDLLISYSFRRSLNAEAFEYFCRCEALRKEKENLAFEAPRYVETLTYDFPSTVDRYISSQVAKVGDGALILIGDLDPLTLDAILARKLGAFSSNRQNSSRPVKEVRQSTGWLTQTESRGSGEGSTNMTVSAAYRISLESYIAYRLAEIALEKHLVSSIAEYGIESNVVSEFSITPSEEIRFTIRLKSSDSPMLPVLRRFVFGLEDLSISPKMLDWCKRALKEKMKSSLATSDGLMFYSLVRNSEGKDLVSGFDSALGSVAASDVERVLDLLSEGDKIEVIYK